MTTSHWPARLAWALVGLTVLACVGHSMLFLRSSEPLTSESGLSAFPIITVGCVLGAIVGAVIAVRHPHNLIGWHPAGQCAPSSRTGRAADRAERPGAAQPAARDRAGRQRRRPGRADHRAAGVAPRHGCGPRPGEARFPAALRRSVLPHLERLPDQLADAATGTADARTYNKGWI
jgi:hypothetical protein